MNKLTKGVVLSGAVIGMTIGAAGAYLAAMMIKSRISVGEMVKCKSKEAFKNLAEKFSL